MSSQSICSVWEVRLISKSHSFQSLSFPHPLQTSILGSLEHLPLKLAHSWLDDRLLLWAVPLVEYKHRCEYVP